MTAATATSRPRSRGRVRLQGIAKYVLLAAFALPWVGIPLWLVLVNSMKSEGDAAALTLNFPSRWNLAENYYRVFVDGNYLLGLRNSLLVTVPTVFVVLVLGSMAAWAYARSTRLTLRLCFYLTSLSILLPPAVIPTIFVLSTLHLDSSLAGYALMNIGTRMGLVVFLTAGFIKGIPVELEEAASIDGASSLRIYSSVLLPLIRPVLFVGAVLLVIVVWNDFFFGLLMLGGSDNSTLPLTLYSFASASTVGLRWNLVFAHVVLTSLPLIAVYLVAQRRVLAGLTDGGLKG